MRDLQRLRPVYDAAELRADGAPTPAEHPLPTLVDDEWESGRAELAKVSLAAFVQLARRART